MFTFINDWEFMSFFIFLGLLLFVAKIIKEKMPFLNRIIIPSALIAGFFGLIISDGFLNIVNLSDPVFDYYEGSYTEALNDEDDYEEILVLDYDDALYLGYDISESLSTDTDIVYVQTGVQRKPIIFETVYHALAIGFIALTLRREENKTDKKVWSTGMVIVITYLLQALIGVSVVFLFFRETFLGAGLLLPLGFGQGPGLATGQGIAYATGDAQLLHGGALGASIASIGFLVGGIIGVIALNYLARKHKIEVNKSHREESLVVETFEMETINEIRVFDALTMQLVIVFLIYGAVYVTLAILENLIFPNVPLGDTFGGVFHGFNFLLGIVYALIYRSVIGRMESKGKNLRFLTNNYVLSNISSVAFNFMIIASVLTITNVAIETYYILVIVMALLGAVFTFIFLKWISRKIYSGKFEIHYFLGMFGMLTGTASTGLALLKGIDKDFKSPIAEEMVVGSGTAISMALPLFALLAFPTIALRKNLEVAGSGDIFNILIFVVLVVYGGILLTILLLINRKK